MSFLKSLKEENNLHHAYVCVGNTSSLFEEFEGFLTAQLSFSVVGNPDYRIFEEKNFSVDTARDLGVFQSQRSLNNRKVFVIKAENIGEEAQNALLKIFEEPTLDTHFFVFLPQDTLLPTLRSRVRVLQQGHTEKQAPSFLKLSVPGRLAFIKKITDDIGDEKQTKQDAINLVNQIEGELYSNGDIRMYAVELSVCEKARTALFSRGSMTKMILENLAISV